MNSQFTFIQQIYRIIANGNAQDLALFNATLDDFFHQSRAFTGSNFSGNDDLHYFYSLYPKILDRLFGGNCTGYQDDEIHFQTNTKWAKGDEHGWLKQLISLHSVTNYSSANSLNSSNNNNNANGSYLGSNLSSALRNVNNSTSTSSYLTSSSKNNNNHMSIQQIKQHFLHFFHPFHKLFHLLERTNYELHISLLPEKTQQLLHHHPLSQYLLWNENSSLFLSLLLHLPYHEVKRQTFLQRGRHAHQEIKTSISLDPLEYFLVFLLRYPILSNQLFSEAGSTAAGGFLSGNSSRKISSLDLLNDPRKGLQYWVNAVPYLFLLQVYLDELFPVNHRQHQTDLQRTTSLNTNNQLMPLQSMQSTRSFSTHDQEQYVNKYRQLFLQLIISYWIDQLIVIRKDHHLLTYYRKLARANTSSGLADVTSFSDFQDQQYQNNSNRPHPSPLELTVLDPVCKWTIPTCQSLYLFLFHLQRRNHDLNQELQVNAMKTLESGHAPVHDFSSLSSFTIWRQLQMPVYDMLSYIFDHGDESSIDREVVFTAIEIWLLWVQPWEHVTSSSTKKDGFTSPNPSTAQGRSHIEQHWHYYIHVNYHFYSTLFNFFMRMISKCNISLIDHLTSRSSSSSSLSSSSSFYSSTTNYSSGYSSFASTNRFGTRDLQNNLYHEGNRLLYMLEKVIRVFNAPFCEYLEGIGKEYVEWYEHYYLSEEGLYSPGNHHVNLRKLFRTRNNPTSSLHASESNTSLNTVASNDSLLAMILLRDHHYDLFPDRKIDYIENIGISRVREDSKLFTITIFQNLQNQIDLLKVKKRGPFPELQAYLTLFTSFLFEDSESESNAKIAKRLERVQNQLIDVFNYVNLQLYVHQPGSGSLSSPSEDSFASGLSAKSSVRNKFTGKLTIKGKELAHQRVLQCDAKELNAQLVYSRDPLDLPICSFELFPSWTKLLIRWSKELNTRYDIPKTGAYIHSSWHDIYVIYHQEHSRESARRSVSMQGRSNDLINSVRDFIQETLLFQPKIYWIMVQQCFRFNLRFLGTYETLVLANVLLEFLLLIDGYSLFSLLLPIFAIAFLTYTYLFL